MIPVFSRSGVPFDFVHPFFVFFCVPDRGRKIGHMEMILPRPDRRLEKINFPLKTKIKYDDEKSFKCSHFKVFENSYVCIVATVLHLWPDFPNLLVPIISKILILDGKIVFSWIV